MIINFVSCNKVKSFFAAMEENYKIRIITAARTFKKKGRILYFSPFSMIYIIISLSFCWFIRFYLCFIEKVIQHPIRYFVYGIELFDIEHVCTYPWPELTQSGPESVKNNTTCGLFTSYLVLFSSLFGNFFQFSCIWFSADTCESFGCDVVIIISYSYI